MKENKEEKEWQFLGYSQIKHTLSPGDFVSVNINEKGLLVIDATEVEGDTPQTPEWEERYKTFIEKQVNLTPREISLFKDFLVGEISQAEERGRRRGIKEAIEVIEKSTTARFDSKQGLIPEKLEDYFIMAENKIKNDLADKIIAKLQHLKTN